jgi:hypothetical protein
MNCISCGNAIPKERLEILPNTKRCVECSTEDRVGCVDITYHKTGNTIQVLPKEHAAKINKAAKRTGFGTLAGMKGGSGEAKPEIILNNNPTQIIIKADEKIFNAVGKEMLDIFDGKGYKASISHLKKAKETKRITPIQFGKLKGILNWFSAGLQKDSTNKSESEIDTKVDEEIMYLIRNWRI